MDVDTGKGAVSGKAEVVYDYPDNLNLQEYRPKKPDIELVDCPAYVEKKKDHDIKLEECPAYGQIA